MNIKAKIAIGCAMIGGLFACTSKNNWQMLDQNQTTSEQINNRKQVIYQLLVRYFGNKNESNHYYGSIAENGSGKFNDIDEKALKALKAFGVNYVWYTGIIEHATMTDYTAYGIKADDPDIVKGRAGSPYAIKNYYDVDPDLAVDIKNRMTEFENLVKRTHAMGLKVLIDFVPNHVARTYDDTGSKPAGVESFGANDDTSKRFDPKNDFYYIPGKKFIVPSGYNPGGNELQSDLKDGKFEEFPARATGNNVFKAAPGINDWFETIKLNYGMDVEQHKDYFSPQPPVWKKMRDILAFWAAKGVDGFRCDVAEMVPVEFWSWVIGDLKMKYPQLIFIGEAYDNTKYKSFLNEGKFDYLYDKVGLYDGLKRLIMADPKASVKDISHVWQKESNGFSQRMLRFLENHDETRIASKAFAGNPWFAIPGMVISATLSSGPFMIYNGQEVGEPGAGTEGFGGDDGRSSIFDYWGMPQHQKWMNGGAFDGGKLNAEDKKLRQFYSRLIEVSTQSEAIAKGRFYELLAANQHSRGFNDKIYAYLRFSPNKRVLVVANFNRGESHLQLFLPADVLEAFRIKGKALIFTDLLAGHQFKSGNIDEGLNLSLPATSALLLEF